MPSSSVTVMRHFSYTVEPAHKDMLQISRGTLSMLWKSKIQGTLSMLWNIGTLPRGTLSMLWKVYPWESVKGAKKIYDI